MRRGVSTLQRSLIAGTVAESLYIIYTPGSGLTMALALAGTSRAAVEAVPSGNLGSNFSYSLAGQLGRDYS